MTPFDQAKMQRPPVFPSLWGVAYGVDAYGYWQAFEFNGVRQIMRWIPPGEFVCGSPEDERRRHKNETQHPVKFTKGFWLADTACTQQLWQAITGDNPSRFTGAQHPVEQVSHNGAIRAIDKLNRALLPLGLKVHLPSEWQWEYAARAGTDAPFWWGDRASSEQANFNGNRPYGGAKEGIDRQQTVDVTQFAPNPAGLYQVHGNVWEWISTWYSDYPHEPQTDPQGPSSGSGCVVRGGAWDCFGLTLRAARRDHYPPGVQDYDIGLRFAGGDLPPETSQ